MHFSFLLPSYFLALCLSISVHGTWSLKKDINVKLVVSHKREYWKLFIDECAAWFPEHVFLSFSSKGLKALWILIIWICKLNCIENESRWGWKKIDETIEQNVVAVRANGKEERLTHILEILVRLKIVSPRIHIRLLMLGKSYNVRIQL